MVLPSTATEQQVEPPLPQAYALFGFLWHPLLAFLSLVLTESQPPTPAGIPCEHISQAGQRTGQHTPITLS